MRPVSIIPIGLLLAACGPSNTSIVLRFPTEGARTATKQLAIFAFTQDSNTMRGRCADYVGKIPGGQPLGATPVDDPFPFPLTPSRTITNFPAGDPIILIVAYNDTNTDTKKPILQGCSDTYGREAGYSDVEIKMQVIMPKKVLIERVSGNRQVGRPGEALVTPIRARAKAGLTVGTAQELYPLPAVPVEVTVDQDDVRLNGMAAPLTVFTDENGIAEIPVTMPATPGSRVITVTSKALNDACKFEVTQGKDIENCAKQTRKTFKVSTVIDANEPMLSALVSGPGTIDELVSVAVGDFVGGPGVDLAILGCQGNGAACARGRAARIPLAQNGQPTEGFTRLFTVANIGSGAPAVHSEGTDLGITPGGLFVGPFGGSRDAVVLVNSRRRDCQPRRGEDGVPRPCEGSEVLGFVSDGNQLSAPIRTTLTASNAVGLVGLKDTPALTSYNQLMTAGQGRRINLQECTDSLTCLPDHQYTCSDNRATCTNDCFEAQGTKLALAGAGVVCTPLMGGEFSCSDGRATCKADCTAAATYDAICTDVCVDHPERCGCPPNEKCEDQPADEELGLPAGKRCVAQDKVVDVVDLNAGVLGNPHGCQIRTTRCLKGSRDTMMIRYCTCGDGFRNNTCAIENRCDISGRCQQQDNCACFVPDQISIGEQSGVVAADLAVGRLRAGMDVMTGPDIAVATDGGLDLISRTNQSTFKWEVRKTPTKSTHGLRAMPLDKNAQVDVFWWSRLACDGYENSDEQCPLSRQAEAGGKIDGQKILGCAGYYIRAEDAKIGTIDDDGCRRFLLPFLPDGMCSGDFNGDSSVDVVMSSFASAKLYLYLGDGNGGLRDPPQLLTIPSGGMGGALACDDFTGDGLDDIAVTRQHGEVAVLRSVR